MVGAAKGGLEHCASKVYRAKDHTTVGATSEGPLSLSRRWKIPRVTENLA
jgi:hypothetical protein